MNDNEFEKIITTKEELQALLGTPGELALNKVVTRLDQHCRHFIANSPMLFLATSNTTGCCDVSPRGDQAGFVLVIDEKRLIIPERPGNRRFDSLSNILDNPKVGLLFIIPGLEETLRINGNAKIIQDKLLLARLESHGKLPLVAISVEVEECFLHCAKSFKRSSLWDPASWLAEEALPNPAAILSSHSQQMKLTQEQIAIELKESYTKRLY